MRLSTRQVADRIGIFAAPKTSIALTTRASVAARLGHQYDVIAETMFRLGLLAASECPLAHGERVHLKTLVEQYIELHTAFPLNDHLPLWADALVANIEREMTQIDAPYESMSLLSRQEEDRQSKTSSISASWL